MSSFFLNKKSHNAISENKDFCGVGMPSEDTQILEFNQYQKFDKTPYIIYADLKYLIKKVGGCKNNPEKLSTRKVDAHIPCRYSMSTIWTLDGIERRHDVCTG